MENQLYTKTKEKKISLEFYLKQLSAFKIKNLSTVLNLLKKELIATKSEITNFEDIDKDIKVFSKNINKFTARKNKLCS